MIWVKDLDFAYGKHQILKGINFSIDEASVISLIGPNGSGKSTLLKCISGLLPVRDNTVYLFGKSIENLEIKESQTDILSPTKFRKIAWCQCI